ncbi:hypothetical protein [Streptomyces sp. NPDC097619]|uniref:hypothetical protein n=1 Tax=Streptomyces sp. NPDC097619 TaxID=3157228 RepID=UPI00332408D3
MHRNRTTTTLLLGVACAVSAVSGCVNVNPVAVQPAASAEPPRHDPRGGAAPLPVVVQAPALEALQAVPPDRPDGKGDAGAAPAGAAAAGSTDRGAREPVIPAADLPADPQPPAAEAPARERTRSGAGEGERGGNGDRGREERPAGPGARPPKLKDLPKVPVDAGDVCALGRRYGQWKKDSPESRICSGVYGQ